MSASERVDQLLDATERRMRAGGYHAVSFRDVAADVGIRSASVHHHFPQKADLGTALVRRYQERFLAALADARDRPPDDRLRALCTLYREAFDGGVVCLCGMLGAESAGLPDRLRSGVAGFFAANIAWVADTLPEGWPAARRRGEAAGIVATLQGALILGATLRDHRLVADAVERVLERHGALTASK